MQVTVELVRQRWHEKAGFSLNRPTGAGCYILLHFLTPVTLNIRGATVQAEPGSLIVFSPDCPHGFVSREELIHDWMHLTGDVAGLMARMKELSARIKEEDAALTALEEKQKELLLCLPNLPDPDLESGGKENNKPVRVFGEQPQFDYPLKNHVELCESLGLIDYERGAKIAGNGSWIYRGLGARMEWALLNFFVNEHLNDGYELILPPHMLGYECGYVAGQFPKFEDEVYWIQNPTSSDRRFMLPTAETALVYLHRKSSPRRICPGNISPTPPATVGRRAATARRSGG